jgi:hypothetical protein
LKKIAVPGLIFLIICIQYACNTNNVCSPTADRVIKVAFEVNTGRAEKDTTVGFLTAYGIGARDTSYKHIKSIGLTSLPLSQWSDSTYFVFYIDSLYRDTLLFISSRELQMVVENCFNTIFTLHSFQCTGYAFDSAKITSTRIRSDVNRNIKLYLKYRAKADTTKKTSNLLLP